MADKLAEAIQVSVVGCSRIRADCDMFADLRLCKRPGARGSLRLHT